MPPLRMDVLTEHFKEAAFLWSQWERALRSPDFELEELAELAELEERLLAHLDGVVLGGDLVASELLFPALEANEAEQISAAAFALLASDAEREQKEALAVFDEGDAVQRAGVGRALGLCEREGLEAVLRKRLTADDVALRVAAFQVLAFRGAAPGETRVEWLYRDEAAQVIAALEDASPLPQDIVQTVLPRLLVDPRPGVREAAITAGLISGARAAWKACRKMVEDGGVGPPRCLMALALGGEVQDVERLVGLLSQWKLRAEVLWALGFTGQRLAAEACLDCMEDEEIAPLAGEAFSAITGLKLEGKYRKPPRVEEQLIPLEEEDLDANLVPPPEASLPMPRPGAVESWWHKAQKDLERGARYLRGKKVTGMGELLEALRHEPMRRRPVHALELAIRSRGTQSLQPRAFTRRQLAEWEKARAGRLSASLSPFSKLFGA